MSAGGTALCMPRMPECVPTSGLSTTRNRRLLIEADLTAVERPQRVNRGLQTFGRSGHNFPTWLLYGVYFLVIVVLLIAPKMKK